jgi:hypothetical protein
MRRLPVFKDHPGNLNDFPFIVEFEGRFMEVDAGSPPVVIVLAPGIVERSLVRALLVTAAEEHQGAAIHVLVPFASDTELAKVLDEVRMMMDISVIPHVVSEDRDVIEVSTDLGMLADNREGLDFTPSVVLNRMRVVARRLGLDPDDGVDPIL